VLLSVLLTNVYVTVYTRLLLMEDDQNVHVLTRRRASAQHTARSEGSI